MCVASYHGTGALFVCHEADCQLSRCNSTQMRECGACATLAKSFAYWVANAAAFAVWPQWLTMLLNSRSSKRFARKMTDGRLLFIALHWVFFIGRRLWILCNLFPWHCRNATFDLSRASLLIRRAIEVTVGFLHCSTNTHVTGASHSSIAIKYLGYKVPVARLLAGLSHMCLVMLRNPSGYTLRIMQYYFAYIRERPLVGVLLLLHINPEEVGHDVNDVT